MKAEKRGETKVVRCPKMVLYQSHENRTKQKDREVSQKNCTVALQPFSLKHEPKMSREDLEYMLRISAVHLKALLNAACKVVDNTYTFLRSDRLNLFSDSYLQCSNGARVTSVDIVLEDPLEEEINLERHSFVICRQTKQILLHLGDDFTVFD